MGKSAWLCSACARQVFGSNKYERKTIGGVGPWTCEKCQQTFSFLRRNEVHMVTLPETEQPADHEGHKIIPLPDRNGETWALCVTCDTYLVSRPAAIEYIRFDFKLPESE